jgi:hypothetical protein
LVNQESWCVRIVALFEADRENASPTWRILPLPRYKSFLGGNRVD